MSSRQTLVNVDDVGLCSQSAKSLIPLIRSGVVQSISVLVVGEGMRGVTQLLEATSLERVGLHACWVDGERALSGVSILTDEDGYFLRRNQIVHRAFTHAALVRKALAEELDLQVQLCREQGAKITHLDSHQHLHLLPTFFEVICDVSIKLGRVPVRRPICKDIRIRPAGLVLNPMSMLFERRASHRGIETYPSWGFEYSGKLRKLELETLRKKAKLRPRDIEIMTHAGLADESCVRKYQRWNYDWAGEYDALQ